MTCTACAREGPDCTKTFRCWTCHERKYVCSNLVGGFDAHEMICVACHMSRAGVRDRDVRIIMRESYRQRREMV